ncbi:hypothetical protein RI367_006086 [Sorochytrium milnesiophthora]
MRAFVKAYLASCDISAYFIVKLLPSQGFDTILVVVDRLTKMTHFIHCFGTHPAINMFSFQKNYGFNPRAGTLTAPTAPLSLPNLDTHIADITAVHTLARRSWPRRGHKDTGITLLQKVAQLKARHEVYDTHANMPHPAVNQPTFIAASMVPKPTPFEGRPENRASFVIYISHFLELTLTPQTLPSVKVRIGVYLGGELCRWFSEFTAAQPHLLEDYDAFLHAVTRNYTGYDLDLEARHAYHNMRQSEIQDTMLSTQQWRQATTALPRNFEEFDRVEACRRSLVVAILR